MIKKIFFLILLSIFISCSNINVSEQNKENIYTFFNKIKNSIETNNIENIENDFSNSLYNKKFIEFLKKNDFSNSKIIFGRVEFKNSRASNVVGLIFLEEVVYLQGNYKFEKGKWRVEKIEDGGKYIKKE